MFVFCIFLTVHLQEFFLFVGLHYVLMLVWLLLMRTNFCGSIDGVRRFDMFLNLFLDKLSLVQTFIGSILLHCCSYIDCYLSWSRPVEEVVYNLVIAAVLLFDIVNIKEGATRQEFKGIEFLKRERSWKVQGTEDHKMGSKYLKVEEHILLHLVWTRTSWPCGSLVSCH